jgi:hypothetical protein
MIVPRGAPNPDLDDALADNLTLQARSEGTLVPGQNRIQACRRIRGPGSKSIVPCVLSKPLIRSP